MTASAYGTSSDLEGNIYFSWIGGGLWRLGPEDRVASLVGGAGIEVLRTVGAKMDFRKAKCELIPFYFDCLGAPGYVWLSDGDTRSVYRLDLKTNEIEMIAGLGVPTDEEVSKKDFDKTNFLYPTSVVAVPNSKVGEQGSENADRIIVADYGRAQWMDLKEKKSFLFVPNLEIGVHQIYSPILLNVSRDLSVLQEVSLGFSSESKDTLVKKDENVKKSGESNLDLTKKSDEKYYFSWFLNGQKTLLLDFFTGTTQVLFDEMYHPLITISPNITLAYHHKYKYEEYDELWIVLVYWPLPASENGRLDPTNDKYKLNIDTHVRQIMRIPGIGSQYSSLVFLPSTNQLCAFHVGAKSIIRYSNFLKSTYFPSAQRNGPISNFSANFTPLLQQEVQLPYDFQITNTPSGKTWNLHTPVLSSNVGINNYENIVFRLVPVLSSSTLPVVSLDAFINHLYFGEISTDDPVGAFEKTIHCIEICGQVREMVPDPLLKDLSIRIIPKLTNSQLMHQLLRLWYVESTSSTSHAPTYAENSPIMKIMFERVRKYVTDEEKNVAIRKFESFPKNLTLTQVAQLSTSLAHLTSASATSIFSLPKYESIGRCFAGIDLYWDENLNLNLTPSKDPRQVYNFKFGIEGLKGGILCQIWLLYPHWRWFQRLMHSGSEETVKLHAIFPSWWTPNMLLTLLSIAHGSVQSAPILDMKEILQLYRYAGQFDLPQSQNYRNLLMWFKERTMARLNESNYLDMAAHFWNLGLDDVLEEALQIMDQHKDTITLAQFMLLPADLQKQIVDREEAKKSHKM